MKYLILLLNFVFSQVALANYFILIKHDQFLKLDNDKQIFYVKAVRTATAKLMIDRQRSAFLKNENMLFYMLNMREAEAAETSEDCIVAGYKNKYDPTSKKCGQAISPILTCSPERVGSKNIFKCPSDKYGFDSNGNVKCAPSVSQCSDIIKYEPSEEKCIVGGYIGNNDLANEKCGLQLGVKSITDINLVCDPNKVGIENKYPCLPVQIFGYDSNRNIICTADNPRTMRSQYFRNCLEGTTKYPVTAANAAKVISLNPENYSRLDQFLRETCKDLGNSTCKEVIGKLEDAASYVSTSGTEPIRSNAVDKATR